ncbi:MAG: hypothetical protein KGI38_10060 [Thaumarchaeota archaeon]|nr:hypothetical protein [Nitrososphaerota archaeon]
MEGIRVAIAGHSTPSGTPIGVHSQVLGSSQPAGTGRVNLHPPLLFYDVSVQGISDGTATISITNDAVKSGAKLQYWDGGRWVDSGNQSVRGNTIKGDIPVRSLHGTPIVIGTT